MFQHVDQSLNLALSPAVDLAPYRQPNPVLDQVLGQAHYRAPSPVLLHRLYQVRCLACALAKDQVTGQPFDPVFGPAGSLVQFRHLDPALLRALHRQHLRA
jgi:hypothetical protein